jgi:hypothetical protein
MPVWLKPRTSVQTNEPVAMVVVVVETGAVVVVEDEVVETLSPQSGGVGSAAAVHSSAHV